MRPTENNDQPPMPPTGRRILIVSDDEELSGSVADHAESWGNHVERLHRPDDDALHARLPHSIDGVAVVSRDDIVALRYALLVEHLAPQIRLAVTIFDRTVADELARAAPNCTVLAMTDAIVPALLGSCIAPDLVSLQRVDGHTLAVRSTPDGPLVERLPRPTRPWRHRLGTVLGQFRPVDNSSRALLTGLLGMLFVFGLDSALAWAMFGEHWFDAIWHSARTLTTIGSSPAADHAPAWYKVLSTASMLAVLAFAAMFTAGFVERLMSSRLTGIIGARAVPRRHHVVVVGLGQAALRLCRELQGQGIDVVAVERGNHAPCLPLARELGVPVVLGRGGDRFLLQRLSLPKARALAAVSSDGLQNISVAVTARAVAPHLPIVLRAGGDDVTAESQSLFRIGTVCDISRIAGPFIAARLLGLEPLTVFPMQDRIFALFAPDLVLDLADWVTVPVSDRNDRAAPAPPFVNRSRT
ncbi:TrkA family protein [Prauserella sp. Am3]|nr:TrkA family protein [Prauserella sp. Am3]